MVLKKLHVFITHFLNQNDMCLQLIQLMAYERPAPAQRGPTMAHTEPENERKKENS